MPAPNSDDVVFDSIDLEKHHARVVGNAGANDVVALLSPTGITFIDSQRAVLATTTIFPVAGPDSSFLASDSRHALISGVTLSEQYPGTCTVWE